jgi:hypothetical protein
MLLADDFIQGLRPQPIGKRRIGRRRDRRAAGNFLVSEQVSHRQPS